MQLEIPATTEEIANIVGRKGRKRRKIEKLLKVKLKVGPDKVVVITKEAPFQEYLLRQVFDALLLGFEPETARLLLDPEYIFRKVYIKNVVRRSRLHDTLARLIGRQGKTIRKIEETAECFMRIKGYEVGLIGKAENVQLAINALNALFRGKPLASIYRMLEHGRTRLKYMKEITAEQLAELE